MYVNYSTIKESLLPSGDHRVRNYLHTYTSHSYYLRVVFISFVHKQHMTMITAPSRYLK